MGRSRDRESASNDREPESRGSCRGFCRDSRAGGQIGMGDASTLGGAFLDLMTKMMSDPTALANAQIDLFNDSMTVFQ